jgi:hypothetical protein
MIKKPGTTEGRSPYLRPKSGLAHDLSPAKSSSAPKSVLRVQGCRPVFLAASSGGAAAETDIIASFAKDLERSVAVEKLTSMPSPEEGALPDLA